MKLFTATSIAFFYSLLFLIAVGIIIYLIINRLRNKEKEKFEKRDN